MGWIKPKTVSNYCSFKYLLVGQTVTARTVQFHFTYAYQSAGTGQARHGPDILCVCIIFCKCRTYGWGWGGRLLHTMHAMCRTPPPPHPTSWSDLCMP